MPPAERERGLRAGWPARYPLVQPPNAALAVYLAARIAGHFVTGRLGDLLDAIAFVGLTIWAYEELIRGVNAFRRLLGAGVLVAIVVNVANRLG